LASTLARGGPYLAPALRLTALLGRVRAAEAAADVGAWAVGAERRRRGAAAGA